MSFNKDNKDNKEKSQKPRLVVVSSNGSVDPAAMAQIAPVPMAAAVAAKHLVYSQIIKAEDLRGQAVAHSAGQATAQAASAVAQTPVKVDRYAPSEVVGTRAAVMPVARGSSNSQSRLALDGLKKNLQALNDLQARLRFMMTELEDLVQKN